MTGTRTPAVEVVDLVKEYGDRTAVAGVSFEVLPGQVMGVIGPNGAGKTTTLEMLEGLRRPTRGTARIAGRSPWPRDPELLRLIGVQTQSPAFFERLTVREQLGVFAAQYPSARTVAETIERSGLHDHARTRVERLSGGLRQRLSIAVAVIHRPRVLFLDEPTAGLDPVARQELYALLADLRADGMAIVYTSHYMEEVERLCDQVLVLDAGRVVARGTPRELVGAASGVTVVSVPSRAVAREELLRIEHVDEVVERGERWEIMTTRPNDVVGRLAARGWAEGIAVGSQDLEEAYLRLVGGER